MAEIKPSLVPCKVLPLDHFSGLVSLLSDFNNVSQHTQLQIWGLGVGGGEGKPLRFILRAGQIAQWAGRVLCMQEAQVQSLSTLPGAAMEHH